MNGIERIICKALIENGISHEDFTIIMHEEKDYRELKESIRTMESQRSGVEINKLI